MMQINFYKVNQYVVGKNSWNQVRKQIAKSYFLSGQESFILDVESTKNCFGVRFNAIDAKDLSNKLNYIEENHVKDGIFSLAYTQVHLSEQNNSKNDSHKIKRGAYELIA